MQIGTWHVSNNDRVLWVETQSGLVTKILANLVTPPELEKFLGQPLDDLVGYVNRESKVNVALMRIVNDELNGD